MKWTTPKEARRSHPYGAGWPDLSTDNDGMWSPGLLDESEVTPSVVVALFGTSSSQTWAESLTDDQFFELFYDEGRARGLALDQSSHADAQEREQPHFECYDAGLIRPLGPDHTIVAWCHVGVILEVPAKALLTKVAACLEGVIVQVGAINLAGLQATLHLDGTGESSSSAAAQGHAMGRGSTAKVIVAPAVDDVEGTNVDPSRLGGLDLSEASPADVTQHVRTLREHTDGAPSIAAEQWNAADLAAAAGTIADDLACSGTRGRYRVTVVSPRQ